MEFEYIFTEIFTELWPLFNSFLASGDFFHMLITFANSLDSDQDRQNVGPDLDLNRLTLCDSVPERFFLKKIILKKVSRQQQKHEKLPNMQRVKLEYLPYRQTYEPVHEISNNVVCATSKASDQPAHTRSLIKAFASPLSIL